jgi:predicted nucleotidyltransferase
MVEFDAGCDDDLNWGGLQVDLSMLLRYQVDILTEPTLPEERRQAMLADKRPL